MRDAQGNTLTTYRIKEDTIIAGEQFIYGSSRLGVINRNLEVSSSLAIPYTTVTGIGVVYSDALQRGSRQYELSNHLGNVLSTISDKKVGVEGETEGVVVFYAAEILGANDYYPFPSPASDRLVDFSGAVTSFPGE